MLVISKNNEIGNDHDDSNDDNDDNHNDNLIHHDEYLTRIAIMACTPILPYIYYSDYHKSICYSRFIK